MSNAMKIPHKALYFSAGFAACVIFRATEILFLSNFSPVYMLRNPQYVTDKKMNLLLTSNYKDRSLAYGILERTRSKTGVNQAISDLQTQSGNLWVMATDYLASIGKREALPNLRKLIDSNEFEAEREKRIFYLEVMEPPGSERDAKNDDNQP